MDFTWLNKLIDELPKKSKLRRNLIDIAGYPSWENVNSNLLAFYFDKTEEHGFGTLFIDSLIELIPSDLMNSWSESDFLVAREYRTEKGNRIDIVINQYADDEINDEQMGSTSQWAVIIENKVNHTVNNDLIDYWNSVQAIDKIGVLLSKHASDFSKSHQDKLASKGVNFYHVSHKDLVNKVQEKMHQCFLDADDRHLLYLKEFIANTNNYYNSEVIMKNNEQVLKQFHENRDNILAFKKQDRELLKFISEVVFEEFTNHGFTPNSTSITKGKHFYPTKESSIDEHVFRFFVDLNYLRYEHVLYAYFELYDKKNTAFGSELRKRLTVMQIFTPEVSVGINGHDKATYQHIYAIRIPLEDYQKEGYTEIFHRALEKHLWNHPNCFLDNAQKVFDELQNSVG